MMELGESEGRLSQPASQEKHLELRDLDRALNRLPTAQRSVILLVGLEGMSYGDVSAVLGIPVGTVRSRLSRGRETLRRKMSGEPDQPGEMQANKVAAVLDAARLEPRTAAHSPPVDIFPSLATPRRAAIIH